jgi:hypothetical protein
MDKTAREQQFYWTNEAKEERRDRLTGDKVVRRMNIEMRPHKTRGLLSAEAAELASWSAKNGMQEVWYLEKRHVQCSVDHEITFEMSLILKKVVLDGKRVKNSAMGGPLVATGVQLHVLVDPLFCLTIFTHSFSGLDLLVTEYRQKVE